MDEKEQVRLILQRVMGCFVLDATATGWHTPELRGAHAPAGFHWPIAFWNTDGECWMIKDIATDPTIFDPLHDLNDAWRIVEKLKEPDRDIEWTNYSSFADLCGELEELADSGSVFAVLWSITPERICKAALKVVERDHNPK
jgi:Phage ABA sandwich domain